MRAVTPTMPSMSIDPYPIVRMCDSFSTIFGVVPLETSAWNPLTAPHITQMNTNGKMGAATPGTPRTSARR
jgi:hypothetical protein